MTVTNPPQAGTETPSQIEFLWVRYRRFVWVIVAALFCALGINYAVKYFRQQDVDKKWGSFAAAAGLDKSYRLESGDPMQAMQALQFKPYTIGMELVDVLRDADVAQLERAVETAEAEQKPYLLFEIARAAALKADWDKAESALQRLEQDYPKHSLVVSTEYPVQKRDELPKKDEEKEKKQDTPPPDKKPELEPAKSGSEVSLLRAEIAAARAFQMPPQFAKPEIPADAQKVKLTFKNYGDVTIALMSKQAPKHCDAFLEFAKKNHWVSMNVDQIQRPTSSTNKFMSSSTMEMHLGYEATKESDRSKWTAVVPSKQPLEFEFNDLSHFPGAVAGRSEADGKSSADRFFIVGTDAAQKDGERVIFGYVTEGLDVVKRICEASMASQQEEERGSGKPSENITVESVTVLQ